MEALGQVLVVEDDRDQREVLAEVIRDLGWDVRTVADGVEGLALLEGGLRPAIVLLDMVMPRMDGAEFLARLRDHPDRDIARTQVILMTGMPHHARALLKPYAPDGILVKPFAVRELGATLAHFSR